jgi:hypothetical protein
MPYNPIVALTRGSVKSVATPIFKARSTSATGKAWRCIEPTQTAAPFARYLKCFSATISRVFGASITLSLTGSLVPASASRRDGGRRARFARIAASLR